MTKILVLGTSILAAGVTDDGLNWVAPGQIIPKNVATGAHIVDVLLPEDFMPRSYEWNGMGVAPVGFAAPLAVPTFVTKRQGRQMLLLEGKLDAVEPLLNAIQDETERRLAFIYWEDSTEYERDHPLVVQIGAALGLDLDYMFTEGKKL